MAVAGVRTVNGVDLWFDLPTQVCTTFSHCSAWANSERVTWRGVSEAGSIWYFSDDDCEGLLVLGSSIGQESGTSVLRSGAAGFSIKSLMAVGHFFNPLNTVISECHYKLDDYHARSDLLNATTYNNFSSRVDAGSQTGDVSANWIEPLPHN
ncbi:hypothetical protein PR003_g3370 [Phytophthora rubi]|uniref:Uncharacterized protein n=1 Tax=Phytophthora rubi TaxID=129364 RepID=A0A6A3NVQ6_9STRA|nr:hypothetical protein PR001_g4905 [Phytophthora rubi]KAE9046180.1 hypothetical protein PR002_g1805 [Phytophthora rubi]KAE9354387.1 hypothetical protein PR003_g3370 [Phytophthora rubi]